MRAVIQRVSEAKVTINGAVKGAIQHGLAVLLAVEEADTAEDIEWLSGKIVRLRVFDDDHGVMNRSVQEVGGGILLTVKGEPWLLIVGFLAYAGAFAQLGCLPKKSD